MAIPVIPRPAVPAAEVPEFFRFACPPSFSGGPIDPQPADVNLRRNLLVGIKRTMPDGVDVDFWIIEDPDEPNPAVARSFPSKTIRVKEGQTLHVDTGFQGKLHTIHWHGIEPTPMNDGVGHSSFESTSSFTYQLTPRQAGTFFYHCHKNTPLHFEMGLYGALIVDPPGTDPNVFPRQSFTGGPSYDVEAVWVPDDVDPVWHTLGHDAFMMACVPGDPVNPANFTRDGILNQFRPKYFCMTGVFAANGATITDPSIAITARSGQNILIRAVNSAYDKAIFTLPLNAQVIAMDGHPLGATPRGAFSFPFTQPANAPFRLSTARRWDLLVRAPQVARTTVFKARVDFRDYLSDALHHTLFTNITVNP